MTITLHLKDGGKQEFPSLAIAGYWAHDNINFSETTVLFRDGSEIVVTDTPDEISRMY